MSAYCSRLIVLSYGTHAIPPLSLQCLCLKGSFHYTCTICTCQIVLYYILFHAYHTHCTPTRFTWAVSGSTSWQAKTGCRAAVLCWGCRSSSQEGCCSHVPRRQRWQPGTPWHGSASSAAGCWLPPHLRFRDPWAEVQAARHCVLLLKSAILHLSVLLLVHALLLLQLLQKHMGKGMSGQALCSASRAAYFSVASTAYSAGTHAEWLPLSNGPVQVGQLCGIVAPT